MKIETFFTQQTDVKSIILDSLDQAKKSVVVAVAWFTDTILFDKLIELAQRGVKIELIITDHQFNRESRNDYDRIEFYGGFFAAIGNDEKLMHMKFCVIDFDVVISGSANWSMRAFSVNSEEVTLVSGDPGRSATFIKEFERLKVLSGYSPTKVELDIARAIKYFELIKTFISLGQPSAMLPYVHEIKEIEELKAICNLLLSGQYDKAFPEMETFTRSFTQLVLLTDFEKIQIIVQINIISIQIEVIEIQRVEMEAIIEQYNHRYIIELSPLITKILKYKAKIFEKLRKYGIKDDTYAKARAEYEEAQREYNEEVKNIIPDLSETELVDIKQMHREAVHLCHVDSAYCVIDDVNKANEIFSRLTQAYKSNDINTVRMIWHELKSGNIVIDLTKDYELNQLRAKLEALNLKYQFLVKEIKDLSGTDEYKTIVSIDDWNEYFHSKKETLKEELQSLELKYNQNVNQ